MLLGSNVTVAVQDPSFPVSSTDYSFNLTNKNIFKLMVHTY